MGVQNKRLPENLYLFVKTILRFGNAIPARNRRLHFLQQQPALVSSSWSPTLWFWAWKKYVNKLCSPKLNSNKFKIDISTMEFCWLTKRRDQFWFRPRRRGFLLGWALGCTRTRLCPEPCACLPRTSLGFWPSWGSLSLTGQGTCPGVSWTGPRHRSRTARFGWTRTGTRTRTPGCGLRGRSHQAQLKHKMRCELSPRVSKSCIVGRCSASGKSNKNQLWLSLSV